MQISHSFQLSILLIIVLAAAAVNTAAASEETRRLNIVMIMIDDLGWSDLHCQGNKHLDTPNIDRLAAQGMRFTDAYAAAPVCSPTRAAVLTGLSPARLRITNHISNRDFTPKDATLLPAATLNYLALNHVTLAERLRAAGYATGFIGKWHLAGTPKANGKGLLKYYPEQQGFDVNIGGCAHGGPPSFFSPYRIHNLPDRKKGEYLPDRLVDESINFIEKNRKRPFFLALWPYTVHWPMQAPAKLIEKYKSRIGYGIKDARYAAMIEAMDSAIGRLLATLDRLKLTENTIVIFTSDNGGYSGVADNRPLRAGKGYLYEGGVRVPLIIRWPGVTKARTICRTPVISMDFFPTFLEAAKLKTDPKTPLDGESLVPLLRQSGVLQRKAIYFHYPNYAWHRSNKLGGAIREGDFKLIMRYGNAKLELYNLANDLSERHNLAVKMPDRARALQKKLQDWLAMTKAAMPQLKKSN